MSRRGMISFPALILLSFLISACGGAGTRDAVPPTDTAMVQVDPEPRQDAVVESATETPVVGSTPEEVVVPTNESPKPELKTSLVATDPGSVNLTSGKPTLVEFFAFW